METRGAAMSFTAAAAGGFVVFLLCMPAVQGITRNVTGAANVKAPSVSVTPSEEMMEGSSVTLTCTGANPASNYTWYKENQPLLQGSEGVYGFSSIESEDRGIYYCKSETQQEESNSLPIFLNVQYAPNVPFVTMSPINDILEGSSVILTCIGDANPEATYTWYKKTIHWAIHGVSNEQELVFSAIQASDSGVYVCEAKNKLGKKKSEVLLIDVKYPPDLPSVSMSPSGEIVEGSSVNLTCSSDANPEASYTWYKEDEDSLKASGPLFTITDFKDEHSGNYSCEAQNSRGRSTSTFQLSIAEPVPGQPRDVYSPDISAVFGSTVSMYCYAPNPTNVSITKTVWFTKVVKKVPFDLMEDSDYNNRATNDCEKENSCTLTITDLKESDSKTYRCSFSAEGSGHKWIGEPGTKLTVTDLGRYPTVTVSPSKELQEGGAVTLTCRFGAVPITLVAWQKLKSFRYAQFASGEAQLVFSAIQSSDSGMFYCRIEEPGQSDDKRSEIVFIDVKYAPKRPTVSVSPSAEVVEDNPVNLTCNSDANPEASYAWYKKDEKKILSKGPQLIFIFIQSSDAGEYVCEVKNLMGKKRSKLISIDVKDAPKIHSVSVSPSGEILEGISVYLTCSSETNPASNYKWYKKNEKKPLSNGPQLFFKSIKSSNSGQYVCKAKKKRSEFILIDVKYAPRRPSVLITPFEIVEDNPVTLTCNSDANPAASYTWYKEDDASIKVSGHIFTINEFRYENSGSYYCEAKNNRGRKTSSFYYITVSGSLSPAVRWTVFILAIIVFLALMILDVFLFMRRGSSNQTRQPAEGPDNTQEQQEDLGYASVNLSESQTPNEEDEEDEEDDQTPKEEDEEDEEDEDDDEDDNQTPNEEEVDGGLCQIV